MFPPLLCLVLLFGLLLCFPLGVLSPPVLALEKRLYLREQDTGKGLYLVIGNPRAVVIGLLSARHGITPLKLPLVEQIALKHYAVPSDEAAPCVLWYLLGSAGVVQDDLRKHTIRPAAYPEIHVVLDLTGDDIGVGPLRGKYQMDTKSPPQSCNRGQPVFDLCQQFLVLFAPARLVQHLRHLVTGEYEPLKGTLRNLIVLQNQNRLGGNVWLDFVDDPEKQNDIIVTSFGKTFYHNSPAALKRN